MEKCNRQGVGMEGQAGASASPRGGRPRIVGRRLPDVSVPRRAAVGERHPNARMTEEGVTEMRRRFLEGVREVDLAAGWGMSLGAVNKICTGRTWRHVPWPKYVRRGRP